MLKAPNHPLWKAGAVIFSGLCWFLSQGLSGDFWFLLWVAPIPVLVTAYNSSARVAFVLTFLAYLLGRLSWLHYLSTVVPPVLVAVFTASLPLIFAAVVSLSRKLVLRYNTWWVVFTFPVAWTGFEFLFFLVSRDGTAGSIAYSQANVLPVIQIASLTGIAGITFLVTLIPSAIALALYRNNRNQALWQLLVVGGMLFGTLTFGYIRLASTGDDKRIKVALITEAESLHEESDHPDMKAEKDLLAKYIDDVTVLVQQEQVELAVLPEKALDIPSNALPAVINQFKETSAALHVGIVIGVTQLDRAAKKNLALVFSQDGQLLTSYTKVNLYEGELQSGFIPGTISEGYLFKGLRSGVAICKDLDFDSYIRQYRNVFLMTVPAWDFVQDDWLHSRMAILRSVEEGFSMVRVARQGRLTINDRYGRVLAEKSSADGAPCRIIGEVPVSSTPLTFYGRFGGWFGALNLVGLIFFMYLIIRKPRV